MPATSTADGKRRSAAEVSYDHLKREILTGVLEQGQELSEISLSERLGVSRTPVREALQRLQSEGLVRVFPKKGAIVVPVTADEAVAVWDAREMVELWTAPAAFARGEQVARRLDEMIAVMEAGREFGDVVTFSTADRDFHEVLVDAAENPRISQFYRSLRERQMLINVAGLQVTGERLDRAIADHRRIAELVAGDDLDALLDFLRKHLDWSRDVVLRAGVEGR